MVDSSGEKVSLWATRGGLGNVRSPPTLFMKIFNKILAAINGLLAQFACSDQVPARSEYFSTI